MKTFIKKYPKRIITAFLVVLLIAVVGTVNNYKTYGETSTEGYYLKKQTIEFMREIYGDVTIVNGARYSAIFYGQMNLGAGNKGYDFEHKLIGVSTDSEQYADDDTVKVTVENKILHEVDFYKGKYILEIYLDGIWYTVHSGKINAKYDELINLRDGESYEFEIPLNSVREVSNEPVTLIEGKYRLIVPVYVLHIPDKGEEEDKLIACNFKIK